MGSKVLPVLVMLMAAVLLISAEVTPNKYKNFDKKDEKQVPNGVYDSKWGYGGWGSPYYGGWGGPYYGGWGSPWTSRGWGWGGPWRRSWGWGGGWRPNEHVEAGVNGYPHN